MSNLSMMLVAMVWVMSSCDQKPKPTVNQQIPPKPAEDHGNKVPHGYGGTMTSFQLVDAVDIGLIDLNKTPEYVDVNQLIANPISLIYAGHALSLNECSFAPDGATHLAEMWGQDNLLDLYSPGETDWFKTAMESLQEEHPCSLEVPEDLGESPSPQSLEKKEPCQVFRPQQPVHPSLVQRLGEGVNAENWLLNAIRIRIADEDKLVDKPTEKGKTVTAQIKLNYELDRWQSAADKTIVSASAIHSIAIRPIYFKDFVYDVFSIQQDPRKSGCDLLRILNKYIRGIDYSYSGGVWSEVGPSNLFALPRSSYFFMHTNIFDNQENIQEWRFTEHKPVRFDSVPFTPSSRALLKQAYIDSYAETWRTNKRLAGDSVADDAVPPFVKDFNLDGRREILGPFRATVNHPVAHTTLRIVPMTFPHLTTDSSGANVRINTAKEPVKIWFSGTRTDAGLNQEFPSHNIRLVDDESGKPVSFDHPAYAHEESMTCAQCHSRRFSNEVGSNGKLTRIPFMNFRHIGFGDGGNVRCNPFFSTPRAGLKTELSEFLLLVANGRKLHGYKPRKQDSSGNLMATMDSFSELTGIDAMRCIDVTDTKKFPTTKSIEAQP